VTDETPAQWEQRWAREADWNRDDWGPPSLPADHPRIIRARRIGWLAKSFLRGARWGHRVAAGRRERG
jgi:hypothetical protein